MQNMMQNYVAEFKTSFKQYDELFDKLFLDSNVSHEEIHSQLSVQYNMIKKIIDADILMEEQGGINQQQKIKESSENISIFIFILNFIVILIIIFVLLLTSKSIRSQQIKIEEQSELLEIKNLTLQTKLLEKQKELLKQERFSAIGELSVRIAHDIRNPLGIIRISIDNIKLKYDDPEFIKKSVTRCENAVQRITHQVEEVMDFLKDSPLTLEPVSLSDSLKSVIDGLMIPDGIKIILPTKNIHILGDSIKLESLFYNLIINAIQKLGNKGTITIGVFDEPDNMIKITIEDDGESISDDILKKIFEPLYTTKQKGTGLGLASCKKIVEQHRGTILVTNNPMTFTIILPSAN
jgi:signal transduction histidine kinase